jgi:hypothetical protein
MLQGKNLKVKPSWISAYMPLDACNVVKAQWCYHSFQKEKNMMRRIQGLLLILTLTLCFVLTNHTFAQPQNPLPLATSPEAKRESLQHRVQFQLLVGSNGISDKLEFPSTLESIVKQLKLSLPFKSYRLIATYLYNVADGSNLEVSDVTYAPFEAGSGLAPKFYNFAVSNIKSNSNIETVHLSRLKFELQQRIFTENKLSENDKAAKPVFNMVSTGISTELNVRVGVPTVVGTTTSALSDGVLVLIVTVN